jgi:predicted molibdopterin-dependent oxidoreductase YjgC
VAFLGSSKCSNEENYLFQKLGRVILGTNNLDNGGYLSGRPALKSMQERLDGGGRIAPLSDLEKAEVIFVIGANPIQSAPVAGYFLKRASKIKGIPLIVADPMRTGLKPFSSLWLPLVPRSDRALINALAAVLYQREAYDTDFIKRFTAGFDRYRDGLISLDPDRVSRVTGLDMEHVERAADLLEGKKISFVVGHGILQQRYGVQALDALLNLALMTGSMGDKGKGFYVVALENNEMGAWDMGAVPDCLPGRQPISNDRRRKYLERVWQVNLSPDQGLDMIRMIEEAEKGNLKALYIMGENPLRSLPQPEQIRRAFGNLELLVVQDILANETTCLADVVLPGAAFSEKCGSFTNMEGRIQSFDPVVAPPGEAKPDWEILELLAAKMGYPEQYASFQAIRADISKQIPMYSELTEGTGESWINETSSRSLFHPQGEGELIHFSPVISVEDEETDKNYPFKALLGALRYHLGSGTRTGHSDRINDCGFKGEMEISPEDGARLGIREGDDVRISSPYGAIEREARLEDNANPGTVLVPKAFHDNDARNLFPLTALYGPDSPGFKEVRVTVEKI